MPPIDSIVRAALAHRAPRGAGPTHVPFALSDDTELTPLEVFVVALDVEQTTSREWPLERLSNVRTVGELIAFFVGDAFEHVVVHALAEHLGVPPGSIGRSSDLRGHLGMTARDLALVLLRLEEVARIEFPIATVALVHSVGDLVEMFRAITRRSARWAPRPEWLPGP